MAAILVIPKIPITVRPGTMDDLPFIDALQKKHTKQVGWMPTKQFEGKINAGHVLVAEMARHGMPPHPSPLPEGEGAERVGYLIGNDQYFKRDDVGIIYQINIAEGKRRGLIGASLLNAQFERSAYGCKLYCCWCAQDIEANYFWESLGFVPLAFRAGSEKRGSKGGARVHIFWQKRIREGDMTTPYWFPAQTNSGSIREDRLVLPIPPGTHWRDVMPIVLPGEESTKLHDPQAGSPNHKHDPRAGSPSSKSKIQNEAPTLRQPTRMGAQFGPPPPDLGRQPEPPPVVKEKPVKKPKRKNDPKLVAAARELRDRWLERVNSNPTALPVAATKYQVCKHLEAPHATPTPLLEAA